MRLLLIDNYDSFTYNLYDYLLQTGVACIVLRNDAFEPAAIEGMGVRGIVLSPGPRRPEQAGCMMAVIEQYHQRLPMLGVCLGHQALGMFFGADLHKAPAPMHGKTSVIRQEGHAMFEGIASEFSVMRYHSLTLSLDPAGELLPTARSMDDATLMAMAHRELPLWGVQFHPESCMSEGGLQILENFIKIC